MKLATTIGEMYAFTSSPAEAVRAYEDTGFKYLDYSFYNVIHPNSAFLAADGDAWRREVSDAAAAAAALGIQFVQAHAPNYNPAADCDHAAGLLAVRRSIEACGLLGIPNLVIHTGFGPQHLYPQDKRAYFDTNLAFLQTLYPVMEKHNVTVCIENSAENNMGSYYFFMTAGEMNEFIEFANHPLLAACWDVGHANMRKSDQYQELTTLGANLRAVHIHDNDGQRDLHLAPYLGDINLDPIIRALVDMSFKGCFTFEADGFLKYGSAANDRPLAHPSLEVKRAAVTLLYSIGKSALETYRCFEE